MKRLKELNKPFIVDELQSYVEEYFKGKIDKIDSSKVFTTLYNTFTPTNAVYTPTTGQMVITIGSHTLTTGQLIRIEPNGITFTCAQDNNGTNHSYPRASDPSYKDAYNFRGLIKSQLKDFPEAIADYSKAIEINSKYEEAYKNRATSKCYLEDYEGAIADYKKAIEINHEDEIIKGVLLK